MFEEADAPPADLLAAVRAAPVPEAARLMSAREFADAEEQLEDGVAIASQYDERELLNELSCALSKCFMIQNKYKQALEALNLYRALGDIDDQETLQRRLRNLEAQIERDIVDRLIHRKGLGGRLSRECSGKAKIVPDRDEENTRCREGPYDRSRIRGDFRSELHARVDGHLVEAPPHRHRTVRQRRGQRRGLRRLLRGRAAEERVAGGADCASRYR